MQNEQSKRQFMRMAGIAAVAAIIAPRMAFASASDVAAEIKKLYGDKAPASGRIKLDVPQIAENGLVVPINIDVESPMTAADYVKSVHVFAEGNPQPGVVTYRFTPECGKASASTRMRLAQTQDIVVVAEMSNGQLFSTRQEVKVTIGGCGG
jgi:sulfur-oxidizing protein SoxY